MGCKSATRAYRYPKVIEQRMICFVVFLVGIHIHAPAVKVTMAARVIAAQEQEWHQHAQEVSIHGRTTYTSNPSARSAPMHMPAGVTHAQQQEPLEPLPLRHRLQNVDQDWEKRFQAWLEYIEKTSDFPSETDDEVNSAVDAEYEEAEVVAIGSDESFAGNRTSDPNKDLEEKNRKSTHNKFKPKMRITVAKDGSGDFTSIQDAVDHVPEKFNKRVLIRIKAGVYREKVRIHKDKPYITFQGDKQDRTIITYDSTAGDRSGRDHTPLRTYQSATVAVNSKFFIARNIVFQNSAPAPAPGAVGQQAVAFRISADMAAFYKCSFLGRQDTLYDHNGRHYFKNCYIEGTVDFIFGNGRSLYKNCLLNALNNSGQIGSLTAQKRNETTLDTGFSFVDSSIRGSGQVYLGRAWGNDSRVVFSYSYMDSVVLPTGWDDWGVLNRDRTVFYAEFKCKGPGAAENGERVSWSRILSAREAKPFLSTGFINGKSWLPHL